MRDHAILDNSARCQAISGAHGAGGRLEKHFWAGAEPVPPDSSKLVTRTADSGEGAQWERLRELAAQPPKSGWGFKDSFARLDPGSVEGLGPRLLFDARWYGWDAGPEWAREPEANMAFELVGDEQGLARWEAAWSLACGDGVGYARLKARPETLLCIACQTARERI